MDYFINSEPLNTFGEAFEAFRTAVELRFVHWLSTHADVFAANIAKFGFIWVEKFLSHYSVPPCYLKAGQVSRMWRSSNQSFRTE